MQGKSNKIHHINTASNNRRIGPLSLFRYNTWPEGPRTEKSYHLDSSEDWDTLPPPTSSLRHAMDTYNACNGCVSPSLHVRIQQTSTNFNNGASDRPGTISRWRAMPQSLVPVLIYLLLMASLDLLASRLLLQIERGRLAIHGVMELSVLVPIHP